MAPAIIAGRVRRLTATEIKAYDLVPAELSRRVVLIKVWELPGPYIGMALGRVLLVTDSIPPTGSSRLLAHELVHVRQWAELGVVGFGYRYLRDFLRQYRLHRRWHQAYLRVGAEIEARELAEEWFQRRVRPSGPH